MESNESTQGTGNDIPYIPAATILPEITVKGVILGILLSMVLAVLRARSACRVILPVLSVVLVASRPRGLAAEIRRPTPWQLPGRESCESRPCPLPGGAPRERLAGAGCG